MIEKNQFENIYAGGWEQKNLIIFLSSKIGSKKIVVSGFDVSKHEYFLLKLSLHQRYSHFLSEFSFSETYLIAQEKCYLLVIFLLV